MAITMIMHAFEFSSDIWILVDITKRRLNACLNTIIVIYLRWQEQVVCLPENHHSWNLFSTCQKVIWLIHQKRFSLFVLLFQYLTQSVMQGHNCHPHFQEAKIQRLTVYCLLVTSGVRLGWRLSSEQHKSLQPKYLLHVFWISDSSDFIIKIDT